MLPGPLRFLEIIWLLDCRRDPTHLCVTVSSLFCASGEMERARGFNPACESVLPGGPDLDFVPATEGGSRCVTGGGVISSLLVTGAESEGRPVEPQALRKVAGPVSHCGTSVREDTAARDQPWTQKETPHCRD